jgi:kynurenine formamidase
MCLAHTAATIHEHRVAGTGLTRRAALVGGAAAAVTAALPGTASAETHPGAPPLPGRGRHGRLQDLTYEFRVDFPVFVPSEAPTRRDAVTFESGGYYLQEWTFYEHTATHLDAPGHFTPGGRLSPDLTLEDLLAPAVVIDIADRAGSDPDAAVSVDDIRRFERRHGRIPERAAVLMYSGWQARVGDADAYRNLGEDGAFHFPGFAPETTEWLIRRRRISSIGVDTLSLDPGNSTTFETHVVLTAADRYGLENLAELHRIPPAGSSIVVGLVPWQEGSGGPCRVFAHW